MRRSRRLLSLLCSFVQKRALDQDSQGTQKDTLPGKSEEGQFETPAVSRASRRHGHMKCEIPKTTHSDQVVHSYIFASLTAGITFGAESCVGDRDLRTAEELLVRSYYQFNTASYSKLRSEVWSGNLKYRAGRLRGNRLCRTFSFSRPAPAPEKRSQTRGSRTHATAPLRKASASPQLNVSSQPLSTSHNHRLDLLPGDKTHSTPQLKSR
ncbi:Hypothetical_protein [Hexamita inflata]|uniref:Hypothetical_protein n=1 Tax=Hexamita inflata TaxID=28002 RepID=A0AA86NTD3_9EUKA|nr:Hypothetical protein HINF_LOCUS13842 [Hexamita inflata]